MQMEKQARAVSERLPLEEEDTGSASSSELGQEAEGDVEAASMGAEEADTHAEEASLTHNDQPLSPSKLLLSGSPPTCCCPTQSSANLLPLRATRPLALML